MKQAILKILERAGYVIVKTDTWREFERRLAEAAFAQAAAARANAPAAANPVLESELSECRSQLSAVESQLAQCRSQSAASEGQLAQCRNQLAECASERHSLSLRIGRAEANARSTDRERTRLQSELTTWRDQIARADTAGRIGELETEGQRLRQRVADLETYLKETRGPDHNFYL